jgi:predicted NodU family carbamoyl transferase
MLILGIHNEHDGGVALLEDGRLALYVEAQKDNNIRYSNLTKRRLEDAILRVNAGPDVLAFGGWYGKEGGYHGCDVSVTRIATGNGEAPKFTTSHERAHLFCAYGMSPFEQGHPCYALIWEGDIGKFYSIDGNCEVTCLASPVSEPGHRYAFLYELADPRFPDDARGWTFGVAGKLMALASMRTGPPLSSDEQKVLTFLLDRFDSRVPIKKLFKDLPFYNAGLLSEVFRLFARRFSDALFDRFYAAVKEVCKERRPLLIAGGCGLNCDWNSKWLESGLFEDVFIPPAADDSGAALGAAIDAQRRFTGNAKVAWEVACGETFCHDVKTPQDFVVADAEPDCVARLLEQGAVLAWVQGRYEIGPRALGNRSLLAAPFQSETKDRLNRIKERESYRPVAPVCIEERVSKWFEWSGASPYMLHFQMVRSPELQAVRHDDNTARVQTVNAAQNKRLYDLLCSFERLTGFGVLCNTSLNFHGRGFINRMSDLIRFVKEREIDGFVVDSRLYVLKNSRWTGLLGSPAAVYTEVARV